jgi:hypothetical protein
MANYRMERYKVRFGRHKPSDVFAEYRSISHTQALMVYLAEQGAEPVMVGEKDLIVKNSDYCGVYTVQSEKEYKVLNVLPF